MKLTTLFLSFLLLFFWLPPSYFTLEPRKLKDARKAKITCKNTIETQKKDPFTEWAISNKMMKNIKIVQSPTIRISKTRILEFYDVHCLEASDSFNGVDNQPMTTTLVLSPAIFVVNGQTLLEKSWKVTDLSSETTGQSTNEQGITPTIVKIDWIHPETKEKLEETTYT